MKIGMEPNLRGRRLKAYKLGYRKGVEDTPKGDELVWQEHVRRLEQVADTLRQMLDIKERELQFAEDRIDQLMNSVVIIRDKK